MIKIISASNRAVQKIKRDDLIGGCKWQGHHAGVIL